MKSFLLNVFAAAVVVTMAVLLSLALFVPQMLYADPPVPPVPAVEKPGSDQAKPVPVADPVDDKDVLITKLSNQVYRVDVKKTAAGLEEYEAALVKFSKEHPSAHPSPAPPNQKGNIGETVYYWNVDEK